MAERHYCPLLALGYFYLGSPHPHTVQFGSLWRQSLISPVDASAGSEDRLSAEAPRRTEGTSRSGRTSELFSSSPSSVSRAHSTKALPSVRAFAVNRTKSEVSR